MNYEVVYKEGQDADGPYRIFMGLCPLEEDLLDVYIKDIRVLDEESEDDSLSIEYQVDFDNHIHSLDSIEERLKAIVENFLIGKIEAVTGNS